LTGKIRQGGPADRRAVTAIAFSGMSAFGIRPEPETLDRDVASFGDRAQHKLAELVLEEEGGRIVGCVVAVRTGPQKAKLFGLYVLPEAQGRGYGRRLLQAALDACRQAGVRTVELTTWGKMTTAVAMYERSGWVRAPDPDPSEGADRAYRLEL
jgi:ribosomal protein S18 acetylase RimI-like enzyme